MYNSNKRLISAPKGFLTVLVEFIELSKKKLWKFSDGFRPEELEQQLEVVKAMESEFAIIEAEYKVKRKLLGIPKRTSTQSFKWH